MGDVPYYLIYDLNYYPELIEYILQQFQDILR